MATACLSWRAAVLSVGCSLLISLLSYAQDGAALFDDLCSDCHSIGDGVYYGPDLMGVEQRHSATWFLSFIKSSRTVIASGDKDAVALFEANKKRMMPDFDVSDAEIKAIIAYIKSMNKSAPQETTQETQTTDQGENQNTTEQEETTAAVSKETTQETQTTDQGKKQNTTVQEETTAAVPKETTQETQTTDHGDKQNTMVQEETTADYNMSRAIQWVLILAIVLFFAVILVQSHVIRTLIKELRALQRQAD